MGTYLDKVYFNAENMARLSEDEALKKKVSQLLAILENPENARNYNLLRTAWNKLAELLGTDYAQKIWENPFFEADLRLLEAQARRIDELKSQYDANKNKYETPTEAPTVMPDSMLGSYLAPEVVGSLPHSESEDGNITTSFEASGYSDNLENSKGENDIELPTGSGNGKIETTETVPVEGEGSGSINGTGTGTGVGDGGIKDGEKNGSADLTDNTNVSKDNANGESGGYAEWIDREDGNEFAPDNDKSVETPTGEVTKVIESTVTTPMINGAKPPITYSDVVTMTNPEEPEPGAPTGTTTEPPETEEALNGSAVTTPVINGAKPPLTYSDSITINVPEAEKPKQETIQTPTETPTETPTPTGTPTTGGGSVSGTPTVPETPTVTPTVPEDDTGDDFDEKRKKNEEIGNLNIREGAMTYEEWMRAAGIDTQRDFNAAAKAAAKEYDRSLGTYGATAEAMGRAGLSGSGYSDYLTGNAYAARQGSIDTARQTKTLADDASRQGYMNYLQDYEDGQRGNIAAAIGELSAMGLTGDKAKQYLSMMGIDAGYADYVVGIVDEMAAEGDPDKQALLAEILNNDLSGDAAMSYAKFLGFDDATAAEVIGMADQLSAAGKTAQADALRANVYSNLLSMGLTGEDAIYFATEISGMDEESAKALVAQTDALLEKQAAAEASKAEPVTIDIGIPVYNQLKRVWSLIKNPTEAMPTGRWFGITNWDEFEKLSQEEKDIINFIGPELEEAVKNVPDDQKTDAWEAAFVRSLFEYCVINYQFDEDQVFELLRMIGGDKLLDAVVKNGG